MSPQPPTVGLVVVTYQSSPFIEATLQALTADPAGPDQVVVVDNGSTDETSEIVARFPDVVWLPLAENTGFASALAEGVAGLDTDIVAVLNHDVVVHPGWLGPLVAALDESGVGAAMPTIALADRPGHFNTSGGKMTVTGVAWVSDFGKPIDDGAPVDVTFPSGAAFVMKRQTWSELDGMWGDLFLYHEDTDLGWRLRLRGLRTLRVPQSVVSHSYEFGRTPQKLRLVERNRWMLLFANYRRSTLFLLTPILMIQELGVMWVAFRNGWLWDKLTTWGEIMRMRRVIRQRYRANLNTRVVGDAAVLKAFDGALATIDIPGMAVPTGAAAVDWLSRTWVRLILPIVATLDRRRKLVD